MKDIKLNLNSDGIVTYVMSESSLSKEWVFEDEVWANL